MRFRRWERSRSPAVVPSAVVGGLVGIGRCEISSGFSRESTMLVASVSTADFATSLLPESLQRISILSISNNLPFFFFFKLS